LVYICELYVSYRDIANHTPKNTHVPHVIPATNGTEKCLVERHRTFHGGNFHFGGSWGVQHGKLFWESCISSCEMVERNWLYNTAWKNGLGKLIGFTASL